MIVEKQTNQPAAEPPVEVTEPFSPEVIARSIRAGKQLDHQLARLDKLKRRQKRDRQKLFELEVTV